jgi:protocatechuate 4,5-dioxygenase alpha chain
VSHSISHLSETFSSDRALEAPTTFIYTGPMSTAGQSLNRFALSLKSAPNRTRFLENERAYMDQFKLSEAEIALVTERDWTGLLCAGTHLQAALKIAATVGQNLWAIGAHNTGSTVEEIIDACPRRVRGLPKAM